MKKTEKITLQTSTGFVIVNLSDLMYCEGDSNYTMLFFKNGSKVHVAKLLTYFEQLIGTTEFVFYRVHRSYLINIEYIIEYKHCKHRRVILSNKAEIPISNRKAREFCNVMKSEFIHLD